MPRSKSATSNSKEPVTNPVPSKTLENEAVAVAHAAEESQEGGGSGKMSRKRTFKIKVNDNEYCSRITGHTPKQAASKALTLIINQKKVTGGGPIKGKTLFTIRETTRGSKQKEYSYQGEKMKLTTPTTYKIKSSNGEVKEIVNRFRNVIEKYQP